MDRLGLVATAVVLLAGCASIEPDTAIEHFLLDRMERARIPGMAAAVIVEGELAQEYYLGVADVPSGRPVVLETMFMIASVSKTVTSAAVMILADRALLDLDAPVNDYISLPVAHPRYRDRAITARMLLTHTSGIEDNWPVYDSLYTIGAGGGDSPIELDEFVAGYLVPGGRFFDERRNFSRHEPGTHHSYSNVGYALLGYVVEEVSGTSFPEFCQTAIFEPLSMEDTSWRLAGLDPRRVATPHSVSRRETEAIGHYGFATYPDGQLRTTPRDYARFLAALFDPVAEVGPFNAQTVNEIFTVQAPEINADQAIAWSYNEFDNVFVNRVIPRTPAHTGGDPGVATIALFDPETGNGVIVFANGLYPSFRTAAYIYLDILGRLATEAGIIERRQNE